jgi:hypothetical protein
VTRIRTTEGNKDGKGVKDGKRGTDGKSPPHKKQGLRRSGPYRRIMLHVQQWAKWLKRQTPRGLRARKLDVTIGQGDRCKGLLSLRLRRRATPHSAVRRSQASIAIHDQEAGVVLREALGRSNWAVCSAPSPGCLSSVHLTSRVTTFGATKSKSDALSTFDERALSG